MQFRIEFPDSKSPYFKNVLRLCKRFKSYRAQDEDGVRVHSVEFSEPDFISFEAIEQMIYAWKGTSYYIDGKLVTRERIYKELNKTKRRKDYLDMLSRQKTIMRLPEWLKDELGEN